MRMFIRYTYLLLAVLVFGSCSKETAIPVQVDFSIEVQNNDYSVPVHVKVTNASKNADAYSWTFEGGSPSTSTDKNPGVITYFEPGEYAIKLEGSNRDGSVSTKDIKILIDSEVVIGFTPIIVADNFSPVEVNFVNTTKGANAFVWTFVGGEPSLSTEKEPKQIIFTAPGEHKIILEASNGREVHKLEKSIEVAPNLIAAFDVEVAFEDDDFQAPVSITLMNLSTSATDFEWIFEGADPSSSTLENPVITFYDPGTYTIELKASNGKESKTTTRSITIFPDTNLRIFNNIKLGINTAHISSTVGAFFSTLTREVYKKEDVPVDDGSIIDIAFFGLDSDFTFNKFVSPDEVQDYTFDPIPNARHTKFINLQESCGCEVSLSVAEFDAMEDDSLLSEMTIEETIGGIQDFDNSVVPRIVLFETWDGRKGAIKIKEFIEDGTNSHIVVDIKVQKQ